MNNKVLDLNIENANKVADNNLKQTKQQIQKYIVSVVTKRLCAITSFQLAVPITSTQDFYKKSSGPLGPHLHFSPFCSDYVYVTTFFTW